MSKTPITGRTGRTVTKLHSVWYRHAIKALVGVSGACALIGVGLLAVPWSDAATPKQARHQGQGGGSRNAVIRSHRHPRGRNQRDQYTSETHVR